MPALDYVFSEVAKLTSLRELSIRCYSMDLYNKDKGYLEQLVGLKQLEVLRLTNTQHKGLGFAKSMNIMYRQSSKKPCGKDDLW
ncbi:hypothetical protein BGX34_005072 [Mortierella sp. NVP85]|nr:hypothetical protein BGX34_005072 [Mortierella sp. NVP85]